MKKYFLFLVPLLFLQCRNPQESTVAEGADEEEPSVDTSTQQTFVDLGGEEEATTSLLAQRSAINQQAAMDQLIRSGTPVRMEPQAAMYKEEIRQELDRSEPVPVAYKNLSVFSYLDDLLKFDYYKTQGFKLQKLSANTIAIPPLDHQALAYPLVRQDYWAVGGRSIDNGNINYRSTPSGMPKVEGLQNDPYRALINLYELSLNDQNVYELRREQEKNYYLFFEEHPDLRQVRSDDNQPSFLASLVYQKAKELVDKKKQEQEARLKALNGQLSVDASVAVLNTTLDEVLSILDGAITSYPVQTEMREFFGYEYRRYPDASSEIIAKGRKIRRHQEVTQNNPRYAATLPAKGIKAIEGDLVNSLLPSSGVAHLQSKYDNAKKMLNRYQQMKAEMEGLLARLGNYPKTEKESQYFALIQERIQYLIDSWQVNTDQFKELLDLPTSEKTFALIPLIELGDSQLQNNLRAIPSANACKTLLGELRSYYYEKVRQVEAAFLNQ